jgi:hypothetical protein
MDKVYNIFLEGEKIGTTCLEYGDAPMGVVFGEILFIDMASPYEFFKAYCDRNKIEYDAYSEDKLISTRSISELSVYDVNEKEIKGETCYISGMDSDVYQIILEGVSYPFYEEEFPHHVKNYEDRFK